MPPGGSFAFLNRFHDSDTIQICSSEDNSLSLFMFTPSHLHKMSVTSGSANFRRDVDWRKHSLVWDKQIERDRRFLWHLNFKKAGSDISEEMDHMVLWSKVSLMSNNQKAIQRPFQLGWHFSKVVQPQSRSITKKHWPAQKNKLTTILLLFSSSFPVPSSLLC